MDDVNNKKGRRVSFSSLKEIREYPRYLDNTNSSSESHSEMSFSTRSHLNTEVDMTVLDVTEKSLIDDYVIGYNLVNMTQLLTNDRKNTQILHESNSSLPDDDTLLTGDKSPAVSYSARKLESPSMNDSIDKMRCKSSDVIELSKFSLKDSFIAEKSGLPNYSFDVSKHLPAANIVEPLCEIPNTTNDENNIRSKLSDESTDDDNHIMSQLSDKSNWLMTPVGDALSICDASTFVETESLPTDNFSITVDDSCNSDFLSMLKHSAAADYEAFLENLENVVLTEEDEKRFEDKYKSLFEVESCEIETTPSLSDAYIQMMNARESHFMPVDRNEIEHLSCHLDVSSDEDSSHLADDLAESGAKKKQHFGLTDAKMFLSEVKRKCGLDMDEMVEDRFISNKKNYYSLFSQIWCSIHDCLLHKFSTTDTMNKEFENDFLALKNLRDAMEKKLNELESSIQTVVIKNHQRKNGIDEENKMKENEAVMLSKGELMELESLRDKYFNIVDDFSAMLTKYTGYTVRGIGAEKIAISIGGSWYVIFKLNQTVALKGVVIVEDVETDLISNLLILEENSTRKELVLEHLLKEYMSSESIRMQAVDVPSIARMLSRFSDVFKEASAVVEYLKKINPLDAAIHYELVENKFTFHFFNESAHFLLSTDDFRLPSTYSSPPKWILSNNSSSISEPELRFVLSSIKLDQNYFSSMYYSILDWMKSIRN